MLAEVVADAAENEPHFAAILTTIDYLNENEFYMQIHAVNFAKWRVSSSRGAGRSAL